jgi:hypothetical protein
LPTLKNGTKAGDGFSYEVPLGKPIVNIQPEQIESEDRQFRLTLERLISDAVELDYRNISNYEREIPISEERSDENRSMSIYYVADDEKIKALLKSIAPAITVLLQNWRDSKSESDLKAIIAFAQLLYKYRCLDRLGIEYLEGLT